jgi:ABC-type polysaccharide/polyol phosphate transport system ATPase subunit
LRTASRPGGQATGLSAPTGWVGDEAGDVVISFEGVGKRFRLRSGSSLQEFVPALVRGRGFHPPFWALRNIDLVIHRGEAVGIIGPNGSGKSTMLKLMAGVMAPSEGRVLVCGRTSPLLEVGTGFHPELTGRENVYLNASILGLSNAETKARFDSIIDFAEIGDFVDTPVKRYSSGMYARLGFAIAVHSDPDILLVDEVLAVGDVSFQAKSFQRMLQLRDAGTTIVVVSHSLEDVRSFCSRAIFVRSGSVVMDGPSDEITEAYGEAIRAAP